MSTRQSALVEGNVCREIGNSAPATFFWSSGRGGKAPQDETTPPAQDHAVGTPTAPACPRRHHCCIFAQIIVGRVSCTMAQAIKARKFDAYRAGARIVLPVLMAGLVAACSGAGSDDQRGSDNASTPPIVESHSYRCEGGQVLYIDILQDGLSMMVRRSPDGPGLRLSAAAQGRIFLGERMNITLSGKDLTLEEANREPILCKRG